MPHPLDGARAKVERSICHLDKFMGDHKPFARNAYTTLVDKDVEARRIRLIARDMGFGDPPVQLILLAGEIVYQLRSALDHVVYQLVLANNQNPTTRNQFPIFKTFDKYKSGSPPMVEGITTRAKAIIESVQPYHRGATAHQDPLWMLHELNRTDKHRVIPASLVYTSHIEVKLGNDRVQILMLPTDSSPKDGALLCTIEGVSDLDVDVNTKTICAVSFAQIGDTKYEAAVPFLTKAITHVSALIERFRSQF